MKIVTDGDPIDFDTELVIGQYAGTELYPCELCKSVATVHFKRFQRVARDRFSFWESYCEHCVPQDRLAETILRLT